MKLGGIFLCWTCFALFFTSQSYMFQARSAGTIEWRRTLFNWLLGSYTWFVLTPLILKLSTRFPLQRGKLLRSIVVHALAAPFFNIANIILAHEIRLRQELEILERYLELEQIRFQDRLTVRMQVDPAALDALVHQLFFQPLVENAIRHGISDRETGGLIDINAERQNGMLHLQVRDNGPGLNVPRGNLVEGVGLSNTRSRLEYLYGSGGRFEVREAGEGGLLVAALFPFHTETIIEVGIK